MQWHRLEDAERLLATQECSTSQQKFIKARDTASISAYIKHLNSFRYCNHISSYATLAVNNVPFDFYVFPNSGHDLVDDPDVSDVYVAEILNYAKTYFGY